MKSPVQRIFEALLLLFLWAVYAEAAPKYQFKIATLAPEGSVWIEQFNAFAKEVNEKTSGEVSFKIYPGGIMGDDQAMYRKMKAGQLHGGGFTMTGIASVVPDFRVMAIPFLFGSYAEVDAVSAALQPRFNKKFEEQGLELMAMTEVGFIYTMSTQPINTVADLQKATAWTPAGDPLSEGFLQEMGITPVQLSIPDVLSSLQTGLINTVFNSLYGSIVLQWFTKAVNITDAPFGYAYGVFLLDQKKFAELPPSHAAAIRESAASHFSLLLQDTRKSNEESRSVLGQRGVRFIAADPAAIAEFAKYRDAAIQKPKGKAFSGEIYQAAVSALDGFRAKNGKSK